MPLDISNNSTTKLLGSMEVIKQLSRLQNLIIAGTCISRDNYRSSWHFHVAADSDDDGPREVR